MIRLIAIITAALVTSSVTSFAAPPRQQPPADASSYIDIAEDEPATKDVRAPAIEQQREDFGSYSTGSVARNLGY